ncbi:MAG: serine/threonine-protein kinase [Cyanobacteria bacterium P01_G01_bin.54]
MTEPLHPPGELIRDRYRIGEPLGQGAIGTTYAALDEQQDTTVAIKVLSLKQVSDWKVLELFEREAQTLSQLDHPCIPQYLDHFHLDTAGDRRFYLVQELIEGQSLETLIRNGQAIPEADVRAIALQVLEILDYLHTLQPPVIHRDIKPQNLIYTRDRRIVLVDFGAVQEAFRHTLSRGGTFVGTVDYMPPEQFRGQATFASDLYSLGVTLIDLLTGPTRLSALPEKRLKLDFRVVVTVSSELAAWLDRLIEPAVEDRFQSTAEARQALLGNPVIATTDDPPLIPPAQPAQSRIVLNQTEENLTLYLPSAPWNLASGLITTFNLGFSGILGLGTVFTMIVLLVGIVEAIGQLSTAASMIGGSIVLGVILALFWLIPWLLWRVTRHLRGDTIELDLRPEGFRLQYRCFPLYKTIIGDLAQLNLQRQPNRQGLTLIHLGRGQPLHHSLWGLNWQSPKLFEYRWGWWLRLEEQVWLAEQLGTFLAHAKAKAVPFDNTFAALPKQEINSEPLDTPDQSRIQIRRTSDRLEIIVPPVFTGRAQTLAFATVGLVGLFTFPFSLVAVPVVLAVQASFLWSFAGQFRLRIDLERFELHWQYLQWQHRVRGSTTQLQGAELGQTNLVVNRRRIMACTLRTQHRSYLFGTWLKEHEKDWVITEIQDFLATIANSSDQEHPANRPPKD